MKLVRYLALVLACHAVAYGADPAQKMKRQFPAKLSVTSSKVLDDGRRELEVNLVLEKDVEIFAAPVGGGFPDSCSMKLTVLGDDGIAVPAEVTYPEPSRIEVVDGNDSVNILTGTSIIRIRFAPPKKANLTVRCKLQGWNTKAAVCLGGATLEAAIVDRD